MKTLTKVLSGVFAIAILTIVTTLSVSAYQGDPAVQGPDASPERHEAMEQAFETNDYEAWKALMENKGRVTDVINADNFERFAEAHALAEDNKIEESKAIRAELGLGMKDGSGSEHARRGGGQGEKAGNGNESGTRDGSGPRGGSSDCEYNN